jgi:hypothetical protein
MVERQYPSLESAQQLLLRHDSLELLQRSKRDPLLDLESSQLFRQLLRQAEQQHFDLSTMPSEQISALQQQALIHYCHK